MTPANGAHYVQGLGYVLHELTAPVVPRARACAGTSSPKGTSKEEQMPGTPAYTVSQQGEWSGNGALDLDYEAETLAEARRIVRDEIPAGTIYQIFDETTERLVEEGTA